MRAAVFGVTVCLAGAAHGQQDLDKALDVDTLNPALSLSVRQALTDMSRATRWSAPIPPEGALLGRKEHDGTRYDVIGVFGSTPRFYLRDGDDKMTIGFRPGEGDGRPIVLVDERVDAATGQTDVRRICVMGRQSIDISRREESGKYACDVSSRDAMWHSCFMSAVGLFQPVASDMTNRNNITISDVGVRPGVTGVLLGRRGRFVLTAKHHKFEAKESAPHILVTAPKDRMDFHPFRMVRATKDTTGFIPVGSAEDDIDLQVALVKPSEQDRAAFGHMIPTSNHGLPKSAWAVGFGLRNAGPKDDSGVDGGVKRLSPAYRDGGQGKHLLWNLMRYNDDQTYSCRGDSGSPIYGDTASGAPTIVGMMAQVKTSKKKCDGTMWATNLMSEVVQDALLDALQKLAGGSRDELRAEIFGDAEPLDVGVACRN